MLHNNFEKIKTIITKLESDVDFAEQFDWLCESVYQTLDSNGRIFIAGNGGSASDAQHFAAELVGRFVSKKRRPLNAEALTTDTSILTAVGNDYSFNEIFSRQLKAKATENDMLIVLSTSGNSSNIIEAVAEANSIGMSVYAFTGETGGELNKMCETLKVPTKETAVIQTIHQIIYHSVCEFLDDKF